MDAHVSQGWCYLSEPVDHPAVRPYNTKFRFHLQPEVVASVSRLVDLSDVLDVDFYRRWAQRLKKVSALKSKDPEEFDFSYYDFKYPPYPHQRIALAFCLYLPCVALFSDKGTGKTYTSLTVTDVRHQLGKVDKTLIVAPATTLWTTWYDECKKFTDLDPIIAHKSMGKYQWDCPLCDGEYYSVSDSHAKKHYKVLNWYDLNNPDWTRKDTDADRLRSLVDVPKEIEWNNLGTIEEKLNSDFDIYIASYGTVRAHPEKFAEAGFDQVILDESTEIKTAGGETTKAVHKLGHQAKYRIAMTGTPMGNKIQDVWSQMYFVDQSLGPNVGDFRSRYLHRPAPVEYPDFWVPKHDGVPGKIIGRIDDRCLRLSKDVLDLPDRHVHVVESDPMEGDQRKHYKTMHEDGYVYKDGLEIVAFNPLAATQKLQQITSGFINQSFPEKDRESIPHLIDPYPPKMRTICDLVDNIDGKAIIWYQFKAELTLLKFHLQYYCDDFAELHGGVNGRAVDRNIREFRNNPGCRFMLAHPKSAQFGHTWNVANDTIYYSYGYELLEYTQSRDRNHRLGQEDEVNEHIIVGSPCDREIYEHIVERKSLSDSFSNDNRFKTTWEKMALP